MRNTICRPAFLSLLLTAALFAVACNAPSAGEQDQDWRRPEDLVRTSDRIISARFLQEVVATVQESEEGVPGEESQLLYRQFQVVETFKGTTETEDTLWVAFEPGAGGELVDGQSEVQQFAQGETYVLFLKGRLKPVFYPSDYGAVLWTGNGEPSFARLEGEELIFMAERPYLPSLEGTEQPVAESAAPFEMDLGELRRLVG